MPDSPRREFSAATKRAAWKRANGMCEGILFACSLDAGRLVRCSAPIDHGNFHYDHIDPDWFSKDNELDNCQVLCTLCHKGKTANDVKAIGKSKRLIDKRMKARRRHGRPLPGTRASGIRKRMNGTVERR